MRGAHACRLGERARAHIFPLTRISANGTLELRMRRNDTITRLNKSHKMPMHPMNDLEPNPRDRGGSRFKCKRKDRSPDYGSMQYVMGFD